MGEREKNLENSNKGELLTSIIISYNSDNLIYDTIDSILMQDYPAIEIIVADDGSEYFDKDEISTYIETHSNHNIVSCKVYSNSQNVGTVKNINNALAIANGAYIKIIAADDTYPTKSIFSEHVALLSGDKNGFAVVGKLCQCDENLNPIYEERTEKSNAAIPYVLSAKYEDAQKLIFSSGIFPIAVQATTFSKRFFDETGGCDERYRIIEDCELACRLIRNNDHVQYIDAFAVNHRTGNGVSTSRSIFSTKKLYYYADSAQYARLEYLAHPEIYGHLKSIVRYRRATFFYKYVLSKTENRSPIYRFFVIMKYADVFAIYAFLYPKRLYYKFHKTNK